MTYERRLGVKLLAGIMVFIAIVTFHWWQDSLGEDGAWVWSCHTMGNHRCGPGEPWIKIRMGGMTR